MMINNVNNINTENNIWSVESQIKSYQIKKTKLWQFSYIPLFLILILLFLIVLLPLLDQVDLKIQFLLNKQLLINQDECR